MHFWRSFKPHVLHLSNESDLVKARSNSFRPRFVVLWYRGCLPCYVLVWGNTACCFVIPTKHELQVTMSPNRPFCLILDVLTQHKLVLFKWCNCMDSNADLKILSKAVFSNLNPCPEVVGVDGTTKSKKWLILKETYYEYFWIQGAVTSTSLGIGPQPQRTYDGSGLFLKAKSQLQSTLCFFCLITMS